MSDTISTRMSDLLKGTGLGAIALAMAAMAMPAELLAQDRGARQRAQQQSQSQGSASSQRSYQRQSNRGAGFENRRPEYRAQQRANRVENGGDRRARRIDNRSERAARTVRQRGDYAATRAAGNGNQWRSQRVERQSNRTARQIENRGDRRANRVERRSERRADAIRNGNRETWHSQNRRVENGRTWRDGNRDRTWRERRAGTSQHWRGRDGRYSSRDSRNWRQRWRDSDRGYASNHRKWDRRWRNNNRYNWHRHRERNHTHYRIGRYYAPYYGYSYRRLGIGFSLGSLFYSSRYWINDPWEYRLPEVYGPYRWVRYYDDVLLVNIHTGEVVDVIHDFFW